MEIIDLALAADEVRSFALERAAGERAARSEKLPFKGDNPAPTLQAAARRDSGFQILGNDHTAEQKIEHTPESNVRVNEVGARAQETRESAKGGWAYGLGRPKER